MRIPVRRTPVLYSEAFGVSMKLENLQRTGSFKLRGAWRKLTGLDHVQRAAGVVTASAGNHGAGVALAAQQLEIDARVVVPEGTPEVKRRRISSVGGDVVVHGRGYDDAEAYARLLAAETGSVFVSAYDDEDIIAGNGASLAEEILEQVPDVREVLAPVGGGGLIGGLAQVLVPRGVSVVGAQPETNCAMHESVQLGRALTSYEGGETCAEGCEGAVAERTFELVRRYGVSIVLVAEEAIERAVADAYRLAGQVIECSAGVALAAAREQRASPAPDRRTVIILSGGNIDDEWLDTILAKFADVVNEDSDAT